ncbi:MAG: 2-oxoacid:acceptor oxidoreductase family protein [Dehalococcoidia bacterium]
MTEVRIHGRGGQGVLTTASLLAEALVEEGKHVYASPDCPYDRGGTPLSVSVRIDQEPIRDRASARSPDLLLVQDATRLKEEAVTRGLKEKGMLILNTTESALNVKANVQALVVTVPAALLAEEALGKQESIFPWTGTVLLGALAAASHVVSLESLQKVARRHFRGRAGESNAQAMEKGHYHIKYTCKIP